MGRMLRGDSRNVRRAAAVCVIELGLLFRVAIVGAQERANENVVTAQRPSLAVSLSLMPGKQEFELELRVRIELEGTMSSDADFKIVRQSSWETFSAAAQRELVPPQFASQLMNMAYHDKYVVRFDFGGLGKSLLFNIGLRIR